MNGKSSNRLNYIGLKQCKNFILRDLRGFYEFDEYLTIRYKNAIKV